ncbi:uncharacterized protein LOC110434661 isoform X2 [Sorghum bicolor]|uniref:uncharacterized protein LOC110434661 isoform X2 n=1 Tax=Sorghum bicolor TaxID=4558 RepID=UPI000B4249E1|nr:uncharacterized protein LOC110434661 isoform X2 [Sorghum bicolor]|eukprot:XP_021314905.1 uncharacterized protein LOC110434661 isoform X2 [Sorghum bicolor]
MNEQHSAVVVNPFLLSLMLPFSALGAALTSPRAIFGLATDNNLYVNDGYATSIFKTGIGKSILATENSRERAQFILEAKEAVKQGRVMDALGVEKLKGLEPGCHFERWPNCGGLFPTGNACWCCWGYRGGCGDTEAECKGICHP